MNVEKLNNINFAEIMVTSEFPEITVTNLPENVLDRLRKAASGNRGEFTSLLQYFYQYVILEPNINIKNIASTLEKISINEMIHLEILSKVLVKSSDDPKFCSYIDNNINLCNYWSAGNVTYVKDIADIMRENIKLETMAIEDYIEILNMTNDDNLKQIIARILEDEHSHLDYFSYVLEALNS